MSIESLLSAVFGSGAVALLAKTLINRALKDLDQVGVAVARINSDLSAIAVKLDLAERDRDQIREHGLKIAALETKMHGRRAAHG